MKITRLSHRGMIAAFVALELVLLGALVYTPPPVLASSTPRTQNGLTLRSIELFDAKGEIDAPPNPKVVRWGAFAPEKFRGTPGGIGLQVTTARSRQTTQASAFPEDSRLSGMVTLSTGEKFEIAPIWHNDGTCLMLGIPTEYPDTVKYLDVSLEGPESTYARWRIIRLPKRIHALPSSVALQTRQEVDGVILEGRATRDRSGDVISECNVAVPPSSDLLWRLEDRTVFMEWMPQAYRNGYQNHREGPFTYSPTTTDVLRPSKHSQKQTGFYSPDTTSIFSQRLRLSYDLQPFAVLEEQAVFHDVKIERGTYLWYAVVDKEQSYTTPSGIRITLPAQNQPAADSRSGLPQAANDSYAEHQVSLNIRVEPGEDYVRLSRSPLYRKYGKPVHVDVRAGAGFQQASGTVSGTDREISLRRDRVQREVRKTFTLSVFQSVDLNPTRVTMTMPIEPAK